VARPVDYPAELRNQPFRGAAAIEAGLITRARLANPGWRRLFPDVYIRAEVILDHLTLCNAALLFAPAGSVLGGRSALGLYCPMLLPDVSAAVDIILPPKTGLRPQPGLRVRRLSLAAGDTRRFCGLPVLAPARTVLDVAGDSADVDTVIAIDALLNRRCVTVADIEVMLRRGLPGSRRVARLLGFASPGAESPMETRTRLLIVLAGLPRPEVQYEVYDEAAFVARLDLAYPGRRLGIEYEGDQHRERSAFQRDAARLNRLKLCGWTILRFTANDVLRCPDQLVRQVRSVLAG